ncbi:MAG TPA: hypothetical protein VN203_16940, partial [Candidatus Acidoferrum sp.]|nr:hypothetical protein [Candidatus Acidoferrum sp.]
MVIMWPRCMKALIPSESPMMAATMGMIQNSWTENLLLGSLTASGISGSSGFAGESVMEFLMVDGVPDQAR